MSILTCRNWGRKDGLIIFVYIILFLFQDELFKCYSIISSRCFVIIVISLVETLSVCFALKRGNRIKPRRVWNLLFNTLHRLYNYKSKYTHTHNILVWKKKKLFVGIEPGTLTLIAAPFNLWTNHPSGRLISGNELILGIYTGNKYLCTQFWLFISITLMHNVHCTTLPPKYWIMMIIIIIIYNERKGGGCIIMANKVDNVGDVYLLFVDVW